jgi:hypothetical protein
VWGTLLGMLQDVGAVARGPERRAFAIACCLAVFDQATASTAIINYAPLVLAHTLGVASPRAATAYPVAITAAKALGVLLALLLVDRAGRRPLLIWGGVGCSAALAGAAVALSAGSSGGGGAAVAGFLASLCGFTFSFSLSWAGLYWVVVSELFSMGAKSAATSAATSLLFLTGAATNLVFLTLVQGVGGGAAFGGFAAVAAASAAYVWRCVPETRGASLADIQDMLSPGSGAGLWRQRQQWGGGSGGGQPSRAHGGDGRGRGGSSGGLGIIVGRPGQQQQPQQWRGGRRFVAATAVGVPEEHTGPSGLRDGSIELRRLQGSS